MALSKDRKLGHLILLYMMLGWDSRMLERNLRGDLFGSSFSCRNIKLLLSALFNDSERLIFIRANRLVPRNFGFIRLTHRINESGQHYVCQCRHFNLGNRYVTYSLRDR